MPDLHINDLTVEYTSGEYVVRPLDGVSLSAPAGSLVVLLGPSGCGKTTLLSALAGILTPTSGSITFGRTQVTSLSGRALTEYRRRTVGVVFQAFNLVPSLSATENVMAPMRPAGVPVPVARQRARALLTRVGLEERLDHRPGDLSGGQQQRVAIARALALEPPLVVADEPTAHLDHIQVEVVLRIIRQIATGERVVVVSTHDDRMLPMADVVVHLAPSLADAGGGPARVALGPGEVLFEQGTRGDRIFVVDDGAIEIVRRRGDGTDELVTTLGAGELFGEMGPLFGLPRSATARARGGATVTGYTVKGFRETFGIERLGDLLGAAARRNGDSPELVPAPAPVPLPPVAPG